MKTIANRLIILTSLVITFTACKEEMGKIDNRLSSVQALIEPADAKSLTLEPSASASLYFEWEACNEGDGGTTLYQIAFDKISGDFSTPVYVATSANNGFRNFVTITHKEMNKIAGMMGIGPSETATFKWTVFSTKGLQTKKAAQENKIAITRLAGFDDLPVDVYITGNGSEGGNDLSKAQKMKALGEGAFEVYTRLKAGQPFYFTDDIKGTPRRFYTADGLVKEDGTSTVSTDGIYAITLDFTLGSCIYTLVTRIGFFFSPSNAILFDLPYIGNGVFQAKDQTVTFNQASWGKDQRYKFRMFIKEKEGTAAEKELEWGTLNQSDSPPALSGPPSYYFLKLLTNLSQWDNKWKLMNDFDGTPATYTIYLQADEPYTHSVTKWNF